jgi:hypothetical protein
MDLGRCKPEKKEPATPKIPPNIGGSEEKNALENDMNLEGDTKGGNRGDAAGSSAPRTVDVPRGIVDADHLSVESARSGDGDDNSSDVEVMSRPNPCSDLIQDAGDAVNNVIANFGLAGRGDVSWLLTGDVSAGNVSVKVGKDIVIEVLSNGLVSMTPWKVWKAQRLYCKVDINTLISTARQEEDGVLPDTPTVSNFCIPFGKHHATANTSQCAGDGCASDSRGGQSTRAKRVRGQLHLEQPVLQRRSCSDRRHMYCFTLLF